LRGIGGEGVAALGLQRLGRLVGALERPKWVESGR
jgi:hypothetical protein